MKDKMLNILRPIKNNLGVHQISRYDRRTFLRGYSSNSKRADVGQLSSHLMLHSHSLEKAMSRSSFEGGRGAAAMNKLRAALDEYERLGYDKQAFAYQYANSAIASLVDLYRHNDKNLDFLREHLGNWIDRKEHTHKLAGTMVVKRSDKKDNKSKNFKDIMLHRYSVREFSEEPVSLDAVRDAIRIATKSPSVCNRQAGHAYIIQSKEVVRKLLQIQTGFRGYDLPPVLVLITANNDRYVSHIEFNQGYIDGGIFAMSVMLALEYNSLACCPLNAMFTVKDEKKIREIVGVGEGESLIMFMAVGNFKNENIVAKSSRYPIEDVVTVV